MVVRDGYNTKKGYSEGVRPAVEFLETIPWYLRLRGYTPLDVSEFDSSGLSQFGIKKVRTEGGQVALDWPPFKTVLRKIEERRARGYADDAICAHKALLYRTAR